MTLDEIRTEVIRTIYPSISMFEIDSLVKLCLQVHNSVVEESATLAANRRDKEYNAEKFKSQIGKHDWVVQFHAGAALAASEISQEIRALKLEEKK